ncbi:E3 ubiquitin-protein ligase RNF139-like [Ruditapes philippinarum]|uniref:E3 ubiquitin-protein ligase RNF139-like n=1 Tax=Ruditapes philippinarum TaxID=129788 RepID=UPI00295AE92C|nr:E3 ubiquitin-protein ligase RNF139-like [Ruditapes philippinarum]
MESLKLGVMYVESHSRRLYGYIEKMSLDIGDKCDNYMDDTSARRKYWCEVLLRLPLLFIIHQWFLLIPNSNYWIIDIVLFIVRYGVAHFLVRSWAFNSGVLLQAYITLTFDIIMVWIKYIDYWTYQDEACEICHDKNVMVWSDVTANVRLPLTCSIILQLIYLCTRPGALSHRSKYDGPSLLYIGLLSTLVPRILSTLSIFPAFMSELSYWIDIFLLIVIIVFEVVSLLIIDATVDRNKLMSLIAKKNQTNETETKNKYKSAIKDLKCRIEIRNQGQNMFPGKWFVRDSMAFFAIVYLTTILLIEVTVYQRPILSFMSLNTCLEVLARWCTTHVIVLVISYVLGLLSNVTVALGNWFLTTEINLTEAFNADIGEIVEGTALITFIEANVLALEDEEKVNAMGLIAFLTMYAIIFQTHDVLEQKIFQAINNETSPGVLFYMRAIILSGLLVTIPSLSTLLVSRNLNLSPWLLFFASGNCSLVVLTVTLMLESVLIKCTWYTSNHLTKIEDFLHYTMICKTFVLLLLNCVQCYCRYICPFFKGWWFIRLCLALFSFVAVTAILGLNEFNRYKTRQRIFTLLRNLQDVFFHDAEDTHECAICYIEMTNAKKLPCNHIFHYDCLRKWFVVRTVCPLCNTEIRDENIQVRDFFIYNV